MYEAIKREYEGDFNATSVAVDSPVQLQGSTNMHVDRSSVTLGRNETIIAKMPNDAAWRIYYQEK